MKLKILPRLLFITIVVAISFPIVIFFSIPSVSIQSSYAKTAPSDNSSQAGLGIPMRLKIPKINVDSAIESVGLTSQGAVDVPKGSTNVAWFNQGPRPGEIGNAVITGHYGIWKNGTPTVFNNLRNLRKGDKIYVQEKKAVIVFVVREIRKYGPNVDATDVFFSDDGKPHLNLVTCDGVWNKVSKSYPKRLVVFTDKE